MKATSPFLFLLIVSCTSAPTDNVPDTVNASTSDTLYADAIKEAQDIPEDSLAAGENTESGLADYSSDFSWVPTESELFSISLEGPELVFWSDTLKQVQLSYKLETSITIMNEGPHCDLIDWKHGATSWEKLNPVEGYDLGKLGYTRFKFQQDPGEKTHLPFPAEDMDLIREATKEHCGEFWAKHMESCQTPYDYPCNVSISSYIFRVQILSTENVEKKYLFLKLLIPMGC